MSSESALMDDLALKTPVMHRPKSIRDFPQALFVPPEKDIFGFLNCGGRVSLVERFNRAAKLNADINSATEGTREIANPDWEVLGTNMTSALSLVGVEGGNVITTAGADDDQAILCPHLDTNQSAWTKITWGADRQTWFDCAFQTGSAVTKTILWVGLKLTNTPVIITDDASVYIRYADDEAGGDWQVNASIADSDVTTDTGIACTAATMYRLRILFSASRKAYVYLATGTGDWKRIYVSGVFGTGVDLIPYFGVEAHGSTPGAKSLTAYHVAMSRLYGA